MQVAIASLESNLLRFSVKGYLLSAGMCRLASGEIGAAVNALERYEGMDASFSTTREGQFLRALVSAYEAMDEEQFTEVSATECLPDCLPDYLLPRDLLTAAEYIPRQVIATDCH
jgi:hypothetical protein